MKNLSIVGVVMLAIGFALGWIAKPATGVAAASGVRNPATSMPAQTQATAAAEAPPPGKRAIRVTEAKSASGMPDQKKMEEQAKKMQSEMARAMVDRMRKKFETRIDQLAGKLNLTPEQKARMSAMLDEKMKTLENLNFADPTSFSGFEKGDSLPTEKGLLDALAPTLSPEQKEELAAVQETERRNKVDTVALKNLSKLQEVVQFEESQRDEVFKILTADAESAVDSESGKPDPTAMFTEGMGLDLDPYDLGLTHMLTEMTADPEMKKQGDSDEKSAMRKLKESIDSRIDKKVEQLRPVLNPAQLDLYRNELRTKGMGVYGQMFKAQGIDE